MWAILGDEGDVALEGLVVCVYVIQYRPAIISAPAPTTHGRSDAIIRSNMFARTIQGTNLERDERVGSAHGIDYRVHPLSSPFSLSSICMQGALMISSQLYAQENPPNSVYPVVAKA